MAVHLPHIMSDVGLPISDTNRWSAQPRGVLSGNGSKTNATLNTKPQHRNRAELQSENMVPSTMKTEQLNIHTAEY